MDMASLGIKKLPLGAIGVAGLVLFGYHKIHQWQQTQVTRLRTQITQEQATQRIQGEVASLLQQVERYRQQLPQQPDPSWVIDEAVAVGKEVGVNLTKINQDAPQTFPHFTRLAVTLQFAASYHQLGAFLDRLEHSDRLIRTDQMRVTAPPDGREGPASVQLVLSTIYVPPVAGAGGG